MPETSCILAINVGSSSIRFGVYDIGTDKVCDCL